MQRSLDSSQRFMSSRDILSLHLYLKHKAMTQVSNSGSILILQFTSLNFFTFLVFFFEGIDFSYLAFSSPISVQLVSSLEK